VSDESAQLGYIDRMLFTFVHTESKFTGQKIKNKIHTINNGNPEKNKQC